MYNLLWNMQGQKEKVVRLISGLLEETMHSSVQQTFIELSWKGSCKWQHHSASYICQAEDPAAHQIYIFFTLMGVVQPGKDRRKRNQKHHGDHSWKVDQGSSGRLAWMKVAWWVETRNSEAAKTGIPRWLPCLRCTASSPNGVREVEIHPVILSQAGSHHSVTMQQGNHFNILPVQRRHLFLIGTKLFYRLS